MPASPSTKRRTSPADAPERGRAWWTLVQIGVVAAGGVLCYALPASLILRALPPGVAAEDLSGSIWHGSAGRVTVNGRSAGAFEWRLHPSALLRLALAADLHWVRGASEVDAAAVLDSHSVRLSGVKGGGTIEDAADLPQLAGWRGGWALELPAVSADEGRFTSAVGDIRVSDLSSNRIADGANLGNYVLHFDPGSGDPGSAISGTLSDSGGPLELRGSVTISAAERRGTLSGTVMERANAPPALHDELNKLAQMRGRDSAGRVPIELEFTF
jgi:hypothetical protein